MDNSLIGKQKENFKWNVGQTRRLIAFRVANEIHFQKSRSAARPLWTKLIKEEGLEGKVNPQQVSKKWENLKKKYKDVRNLKTGPEGEHVSDEWQYYKEMHWALGGGPSPGPLVEPLMVIKSFSAPAAAVPAAPDSPAVPVFLVAPAFSSAPAVLTEPPPPAETVVKEEDEPSTSAQTSFIAADIPPVHCEFSDFKAVKDNPVHYSPVHDTLTTAPATGTTSQKRKRKSLDLLEFLKEESAKEQRRHKETEQQTARFLDLFERLLEKL